VSKLSAIRIEKIKKVMKSYGFRHKGVLLISMWECGRMLNTTWQARHFVPTTYEPKQHLKPSGEFAVPDYDSHKLHRAIRSAVRSQDELVIENDENSGAEFLIANEAAQ